MPGVAPCSHCCIKEGQRNEAGLFPSLDGCGSLLRSHVCTGHGQAEGKCAGSADWHCSISGALGISLG